MRILVTGGYGFIVSNFIRYILEHYKLASVSNVDVLTYAGNLANLDGIAQEHGERYDSSLARRELNWMPLRDFREGLRSTIDWYLNHRGWWAPLLERTGRY